MILTVEELRAVDVAVNILEQMHWLTGWKIGLCVGKKSSSNRVVRRCRGHHRVLRPDALFSFKPHAGGGPEPLPVQTLTEQNLNCECRRGITLKTKNFRRPVTASWGGLVPDALCPSGT